MKTKVHIPTKYLQGQLKIPGSKSLSNRIMIIQALSGVAFNVQNISDSDDTKVLLKALNSKNSIVNIGMAGTAMRFLTAFYAIQKGEVVLTGSDRIKQRPIKELVDVLLSLGVKIEYIDKNSFAPLKIYGSHIKGGEVRIKAHISSQFISALLLIAPYMENGLIVHLDGEVLSRPYIEMTLKLMSYCGVSSTWNGNRIEVRPGSYKSQNYVVESDWSSISYIYQVAALSEQAEISISKVFKDSLQGDAILVKWFKLFGVHTQWQKETIKIKKEKRPISNNILEFDCSQAPDLAQTIAATAVGLSKRIVIKGLSSLPLKETNRLSALKTELEKCDAQVLIKNENELEVIPHKLLATKSIEFESHNDHRMAMCLAPLALCYDTVFIENSEVVNKSYRTYWSDLKCLSFNVDLS